MLHRAPQQNEESDNKRLDAAYAAFSGNEPEGQEDDLLSQLEESLANATQVLAKLKASQVQEKQMPQDAGSPSMGGAV